MTNNQLGAQLILLAAGASSRMLIAGKVLPKGLLSYNGKALIIHQIENFLSCGGAGVVVVLGAGSNSHCQEYLQILRPFNEDSRVTCLLNEKTELGQFFSLQIALRDLVISKDSGKKSWEKVFIQPVDVLLPGRDVFDQLLVAQARATASVAVVIPTYQQKGGHPLLINSSNFIRELLAVVGPARLDMQIKRWEKQEGPGSVLRVAVDDPRVVSNVNTPDEWSRWCGLVPSDKCICYPLQ
ncbi:MAG: NTP transferase domain-containing protein [Oligoflexia bacterium]|nr:NTP transferase domain-containing protein [Oligoflexia bacterium]